MLPKEYFSMLPITPPQEHKKIRGENRKVKKDIFFISKLGFVKLLACLQRTRLAAVLEFEKLSARQQKPNKITDV